MAIGYEIVKEPGASEEVAQVSKDWLLQNL
jgi:hypothetical protein